MRSVIANVSELDNPVKILRRTFSVTDADDGAVLKFRDDC